MLHKHKYLMWLEKKVGERFSIMPILLINFAMKILDDIMFGDNTDKLSALLILGTLIVLTVGCIALLVVFYD